MTDATIDQLVAMIAATLVLAIVGMCVLITP